MPWTARAAASSGLGDGAEYGGAPILQGSAWPGAPPNRRSGAAGRGTGAERKDTSDKAFYSPPPPRPVNPRPSGRARAKLGPAALTRPQPTMFAKLASNLMGPALPFTLGEAHPGGGWGGWAHYAATARDGGGPVSVWRIAAARTVDARLQAARHGVQKLKTVRRGWVCMCVCVRACVCVFVRQAAGRGAFALSPHRRALARKNRRPDGSLSYSLSVSDSPTGPPPQHPAVPGHGRGGGARGDGKREGEGEEETTFAPAAFFCFLFSALAPLSLNLLARGAAAAGARGRRTGRAVA